MGPFFMIKINDWEKVKKVVTLGTRDEAPRKGFKKTFPEYLNYISRHWAQVTQDCFNALVHMAISLPYLTFFGETRRASQETERGKQWKNY